MFVAQKTARIVAAMTTTRIADGTALSLHPPQRARLRQRPSRQRRVLQSRRISVLRSGPLAARGENIQMPDTSQSSRGSCTNGAPNPLGGRRHLDVPHSQLGERVDDRIDYGSQRRRRTSLTAGTDAKPIRRRRDLAELRGQQRQRVGARHRVIHEARRQQLPTLGLVVAVLEQRLTNTLGNPTMRLTMQDQWIDGAPDIVDRSVSHDFKRACIGIDLDFADLRAVGEAGNWERLIGDGGEWPLQILWQVLARDGGRGNLEDAGLAICTGDPVSTA